MSTVIFETEEAIFQFDRKSVMELLEHRQSSYGVQELDTLIQILSIQIEKTILSSVEHHYFSYIALDLINASEGSVVCKNCGKKFGCNQIKEFTVGPDDATFRATSAKKGGLKKLFRKKPKLPGMQWGKGYKCPEGHTLILMVTWRT